METALIILISVVILIILIGLVTYFYFVYKLNKIKNVIGEKVGKEVLNRVIKLTDEVIKKRKD
jgi:hypothetical protein